MARRTTRVLRKLPVIFVQADMVDHAKDLPFPVRAGPQDRFFTDRVLFGEVWIKDLSSRRTLWKGHVRDGELYLDESSRGDDRHARETRDRVPSLLAPGRYAVWLDAWVRRRRFADEYAGDALTRDGEFGYDAAAQWAAPARLPRGGWTRVHVPTRPEGGVARVVVQSRRFHYLYRLNRLVDELDGLLHTHEHMVARAAAVRENTLQLRQFLYAMAHSRSNLGVMGFFEPWMEAMRASYNVAVASSNFIEVGVGDDESVMHFRQRINNLAALVWRLIEDAGFQKHVAAVDSQCAEEHRILLSRLNNVFHRIPRAYGRVDRSRTIPTARDPSPRWGEMFTKQYLFAYFDQHRRQKGEAPVFAGADGKPVAAVKWLNTARAWVLSGVNASTIYFMTTEPNWTKLRMLYGAAGSLAAEHRSIVIGKIPQLLNFEERIVRVTTEYAETAFFHPELRGRQNFKRVTWTFQQRKKMAGLVDLHREHVPEFDEKLKAVEREMKAIADEIDDAAKGQPQKFTDALKAGNSKAIHGIQVVEIVIKGWAALTAWQAFAKAMKEDQPLPKSGEKAADAVFKTASFASSVFQSSGVLQIFEAGLGKRFPGGVTALGRWGKGLGAVGDVGSALLYTKHIWANGTYADELLERYEPDDAVGAYCWHLVVWGGKWMVGIGSSGQNFSKSPGFVKLQALGYLFQAGGELGLGLYTYGKEEKAHTLQIFRQVDQWNDIANAGLARHGFRAKVVEPRLMERLKEAVENVKYLRVEPEKLEEVLSVPVER